MDNAFANAFTAALLDPERTLPRGLIAWNGSDPTCRFNVYRNNVLMSLLNALATSFPVIQQLVGIEFFRAMTREYVHCSPPTSRCLAEYGDSFPDFIAAFAPAASVPYLADVARLEYLRVGAYHAADATPLAADAFRPLVTDSNRLLAVSVQLHPASRWLRSKYAVFSLWAAHQGAIELHDVDPDVAEDVLVIRPACDVGVLSLPPGGADWLDALSTGATLADAVERVSTGNPGFDLSRNLALLIAHGLIIRFIHPDGDPS